MAFAGTRRIGHELDGIDHPADPHRLLLTGSALWGAWLDRRSGVAPDILVGLGSGGVVPAIAVAIASGLPYLLASPLDRGEFPAAEHVRGKRVLVVADQLIHEAALTRFVSRLRDEAADIAGVLTLTENSARVIDLDRRCPAPSR